ncbi:RNase P modulator RnpM [Bacillaceae bacterium W0354]
MSKSKKEPLRKCVITNEMLPKKSLIRVVRNKEREVFVDETGKKNGRGAYLKKDLEVIKNARKTKVLDKQLNVTIESSIYDELESKVRN